MNMVSLVHQSDFRSASVTDKERFSYPVYRCACSAGRHDIIYRHARLTDA